MVTENNSQITSFNKGMNGDFAYTQLPEGSYIYANNLRLLKIDSSNTNGQLELRPIDGIRVAYKSEGLEVKSILASAAIRNIGIVVLKHKDNTWSVYKFTNKITSNDSNSNKSYQINDLQQVFHSIETTSKNSFSIVTRWEDSDNIKLYIADQVNPILVLNLAKDSYKEGQWSVELISSNPSSTLRPPKFDGLIAGNINSGIVSYAYRLFKKNGASSGMSVHTKLVPLIDKPYGHDSSFVKGVKQGGKSGCGVQIKINIDQKILDENIYDRINIYRILYEEAGKTPTISLIAENPIKKSEIVFQDTGENAYQNLTLEEFNIVAGVHVIPKVIEAKNDYLFAAQITNENNIYGDEEVYNWDARAYSYDNTGKCVLYNYTNQNDKIEFFKDNIPNIPLDFDCFDKNNRIMDIEGGTYKYDSRYSIGGKYLGGTGKNVSWNFICDYNVLDWGLYSDQNKILKKGDSEAPNIVGDPLEGKTYRNPSYAYDRRSLRRGEVYRYGIILYDKNNRNTDVKWIADIRVPDQYVKGRMKNVHDGQDRDNFDITDTDGSRLLGVPIGIQFTIRNLPKNIVAYEIVRCNRGLNDSKNVTQGIVSRPLSIHRLLSKDQQQSTVYPSGYLTTCMWWQGCFAMCRVQNKEKDGCREEYGLMNPWDNFIREDTIPPHANSGDSKDYGYGEINTQWVQNMVRDTYDKCFNKNIDTQSITINGLGEADNFGNYNVLQFVSAETSYVPQTMQDMLTQSQIQLSPVKYVWPTCQLGLDKGNTRGEPKYYNNENHKWGTLAERLGDSTYTTVSTGYNSHLHLAYGTKDIEYWGRGHDKADSYYPKWTWIENNITIPNLDKSKQIPARYNPTYGLDYTALFVRQRNQYAHFTWYSNNSNTETLDMNLSYKTKNGDWSDVKREWYSVSDKKAWETFVPNVYTYSKFYNSSYRVWGITSKRSKPSEDSVFRPYEFNVYNSKPIDILDVENSKEGSMFSFRNEGEKTYKKDSVSVGGFSYINWVLGTVGPDDDISSKWKDDENWLTNGVTNGIFPTSSTTIIGPGGRCFVMRLDINGQDQHDTNIEPDDKRFCTYYHTLGADIKSEYRNNVTRHTMNGYSCGSVNVPSVVGSYVCNIQNKSCNPYGGGSITALETCTYYSYGNYFEVDNNKEQQTCNVFDGDTFISLLEHVSMHKSYPTGEDGVKTWYMPFCVVNSIPLESSINCSFSNGYEFSRDAVNANIQIEPSTGDNHSQPTPLYVYNSVYNAYDTMSPKTGQSTEAEYDKGFDYRCYHSGLKTNDEIIDSWTQFSPTDYIDVDTRYGAITALKSFKNTLMYWQENATGKFSVNDRSVVQDANNTDIVLGQGGVLDRYDYIDYAHGMRKNQFAHENSGDVLYWYDNDNDAIRATGDGVSCKNLSLDQHVSNHMHKYSGNENRPVMFFDKKNNELVSSVLKDRAIIYNQSLGVFPSFTDIPIKGYVTFSNGTYVFDVRDDELNIAQWDCKDEQPRSWNDVLDIKISYAVNKNFTQTKTFDNQELFTQINPYYDQDQKESQTECLRNLKYSWYTDLNDAHTNDIQMTNREGSFRYAIPRHGDAEYGNRLRGKYMIGEISGKSNNDFSISYIITKFRYSL